ncbi:hypothetical protein AAF712_014959 [Marasmius tenuissimus]|uniref:F-box domain-containing protein n=1 Tax=Marasmius tenuissimus TaxID=585030 RepID=A0ABR2ZBQ2_9AGAR
MPPSLASRILKKLNRQNSRTQMDTRVASQSTQSSFGSSQMPYDILASIFDFLPEETNQKSTFKLSSAPWTFTRVCRSWRNSALLIPSLWTSIYVNTKELSSRTDDGCIAMLEFVLARTSDRLLDVNILMIAGYSHPGERWQPLLDMLRKESHRWRSFTLFMPAQQDFKSVDDYFALPSLHPLGDAAQTGFSRLESVELHNAHCSVHSALYEALRQSPRLNKVVLLPIDSLSTGLDMPSLPWDQVSYLDISGIHETLPEYQFLSALSQSPNLQTLIARQHQLRANFQRASPLLKIETLHTLEIHLTKRDRYQEGRSFIATYLVLPNLKHLRVRGLHHDVHLRDFTAISRILDQTTGIELDSLAMSDITTEDTHVLNILRHHAVQRITRLEVDGELFGQLFETLADDKELIPNLEWLEARMRYGGEQPMACSAIKLLRSRKAQLRGARVRWFWSKSDNNDAVTQFKELNASSADLAHEQRRMAYQNPNAYFTCIMSESLLVFNSIFTEAENRLPSELTDHGSVEDAIHALTVGKETIPTNDEFHNAMEGAHDLTAGYWEIRLRSSSS